MPFIVPQAHSWAPDTRTNNVSAPGSMQAFGVVNDAGNADESAFQWRGGRCLADVSRLEARLRDEKVVKKLSGKWYYGGIFYPHFGHFLTETVHRLHSYVTQQNEYDGIIFLKSPKAASFDYEPIDSEFVRFFFEDFFNIDITKIFFCTEFLQIESLTVGKLES
jgi:hypothetical protein